MGESLTAIPNFIFWLIEGIFKVIWWTLKGAAWMLAIFPEIIIPIFILVMLIIVGIMLYFGLTYLLTEPRACFG